MFDINSVYIFKHFLTEQEITCFNETEKKHQWTFSGYSINPKDRIFWAKKLWDDNIECVDIESIFRKKIEEYFNVKVETKKLYLNGQAHGQCGSFHRDAECNLRGNFITLVYYPHSIWKPEWGGFTIIIDGKGVMHTIYPEPNSAVVFDSKLLHVGLEPTVHCITQRVTLAHKMEIIK